MTKPTIACIGGFLGAGKTTAMRAAAVELKRRGLRAGIITNDQGSELVDTKSVQDLDLPVREIVGGCFCCKFEDLVERAQEILDQGQPDVILAEAVGSCTDLSATVYQPLRKYYQQFELAPLSILVEPDRLCTLFGDQHNGFPDSVRYLFQKQVAEADLILLNKIDTVDAAEVRRLTTLIGSIAGNISVHPLSAQRGDGVEEWVSHLLNSRVAGQRILDIDYNLYAKAEAELGWLNATVELSAPHEFSPPDLAGSLLSSMQRRVVNGGMDIAHLKILVATETETDHIALTANSGRPQWSVSGSFPNVRELTLMINARVHATPEQLTQVTKDSLTSTEVVFGVKVKISHLESFSPLPPKPCYRLAQQSP